MRFLHPEVFLLIPAFLALGWFWRDLRLYRPLRVLCLLLGIALLARPEIRRAADGLDLWVLSDRSASAEAKIAPNLAEWHNLLEKSRGSHDRLHVVDFAAEPLLRSEGDGTGIYPGNKNATRLAAALQYTLARLSPDRPSRLLVLSDGYSSEPLDGLAERLIGEEIALDYRLVPSDTAGDYRIHSFSAPARVRAGEAFLLALTVRGPAASTVPLEIYRDNVLIGQSELSLADGEARIRFTDRTTAGGSLRYEARILPVNDPLPGNNSGSLWIETDGGPRALLVTAYRDDPLIAVLQNHGVAVDVLTDPAAATVGQLSGIKLVILNNVPAYKLNPEFLDALPFFVTAQGGGLLMGGGKTSYAAGGYFGSSIDAILPVSMELRQEHRKLALAMAIALDRSGSMSMNIPGSHLQKMDLANAGAAEAIGLLGDQDSVAVFAVDTEAHEFSPLVQVGPNRKNLISAARRIQSSGGGICVPTGLRAAWAALKKSPAGRRHVVLFADANDATQETGNYQKLIADMRQDGITISVIGMGQNTDSGGHFLSDVARLGEGRIFFNENPGQLVGMFAQETVAVARSAFIEQATPLIGTAGWKDLSPHSLQWPGVIDGYNLCYLRPQATAAALSGDEYQAPLTAFWQRGAGRTAALTFPLGGDFSEQIRAWPGYGDFLQTLTRWLQGDQLPPGIGLHHRVDGSRMLIDLRHDDTWLSRLALTPPRLIYTIGSGNNPVTAPWEKIAPGHYQAALELPPGQWIRGAVALPPAPGAEAKENVHPLALPFGPVSAALNPEWETDPSRIEALRNLSSASGGLERVDLPSVWAAPRRASWIDISQPLLVVFLLSLLLDVLQTRTGFSLRRKKTT